MRIIKTNYIRNKLRYLKNAVVRPTSFNYKKNCPDINFIKKYLDNDKIFFDVGANLGLWTHKIKTCYKYIEVHAFEPHPTVFKELSSHIQANFMNVRLQNIALSDRQGHFPFHLHPSHARSSLSNTDEYLGTRTVMVQTSTIDEYCLRFNVYPTVLKIDVEGYEPEIILGAHDLLANRSKRPTALIIELEDRHLMPRGYAVQDQLDYFKGIGYAIYVLYQENVIPLEDSRCLLEKIKDDAQCYIYNYILLDSLRDGA